MKGIPFIEQHVEKIVVGVAALLLVLAIVMEAMSSRSVKAGNEVLTPGNVNEKLDSRAKAVDAKLNDSRIDGDNGFKTDDLPLLAKDFSARLASPVAPKAGLPTIYASLASKLMDSETLSDTVYYVPVIPPLRIEPVVLQTSDALPAELFNDKDTDKETLEALARKFPDRGSNGAVDVTWTTPVAVCDLKALREELRRSDPGAKPPLNAIPSAWYNDGTYIVDIAFERQERMADGSWGNPTLVAPLPGRLSYRTELEANKPDLPFRDRVLAKLSKPLFQLEILEPEFFKTKNDSFVSPAQLAAGVTGHQAESRDILKLRHKIDDLQKTIGKTEEMLKEAGGPLETPPEPPKGSGGKSGGGPAGGGSGGKGGGSGSGGSGGGGSPPGGGNKKGGGGAPPVAPPKGGGGLGGGGTMGPPPAQGDNKDPNKDARRRSLTRKLKDLKEELDKLSKELEAKAPAAKPGATEPTAPKIDFNAEDSILVWAHDVDVKPEAFYRYRCVMSVYNPFFGRRQRQLVPSQANLAEAFVLKSVASDWSNPVQITPPFAFFVTGATSEGGALGMGSADVEVYRLVEGVRKRQQFLVQPGERIGKMVEPRKSESGDPVDFTTDWFVVAIIEDPSAEKAESDRMRSAVVVVRRAGREERLETRVPAADADNGDRRRLMDEATLGPTAAAPPTKTGA